MASVLIVDDHPAIRRALRAAFERQPGFTVCGEAEDGFDAISKAKRLSPDLIVLDLRMPVMDGLEAARELKRLFSGSATKVLISPNRLIPFMF